MTSLPLSKLAVVVIGRNEGVRLEVCLRSVVHSGLAPLVVYVDSGSMDGSVHFAKSLGCHVVALDMTQPFTAARARNEGVTRALAISPNLTHIQFIDGDCELSADWFHDALAFLQEHPSVAVACGRRRERYPQASVYNAMCDAEWNTPLGAAKSCGGDALFRLDAFQAVGGFNPTLIAGEEPDLCLRLRNAGWTVWRLDMEMTMHDAAIHRFQQWWTRAKRAGYAFAQGAYMHGNSPERHWVKECARAVVWGCILPLFIVLGGIGISRWLYFGVFIYIAQVIRVGFRLKSKSIGVLLVVGKFAEAIGVFKFVLDRISGKASRIIEYK